MNFEVKNFIEKRNIANKIKYFDVEHYNSMYSMELATKFFLGSCLSRQLQDPTFSF